MKYIATTAILSGSDIKIGEGTIICDYAVIYDNTHIGANCYIGPHVVLGSPPLFNNNEDRLIVGDNCAINANTVVEKGVQIGDCVVCSAGSFLPGGSHISQHSLIFPVGDNIYEKDNHGEGITRSNIREGTHSRGVLDESRKSPDAQKAPVQPRQIIGTACSLLQKFGSPIKWLWGNIRVRSRNDPEVSG